MPTDVSALSGGVPLLTHPLPCAGVVYADVLLDLQRLPVSELPLLSLYAALLTQAAPAAPPRTQPFLSRRDPSPTAS